MQGSPIKADTGDHPSTSVNTNYANAVNLVETPGDSMDVYAKRSLDQDGDTNLDPIPDSSFKRTRPGYSGPNPGTIPFATQPRQTPPVRLKKARTPTREIPVPKAKHDIWEKLQRLDAGLSMADWITLDKSATRDLQAGTRYLLVRNKKLPGSASLPINNVSMVANDGSDDEHSGYDSDSPEASIGYDTDQLEQGSESDGDCDSVAGYDYSYDNMRHSKPFKALIVIGSHVVNAVFDTGASVSIISGNLARRLGLKSNGDKLTLTSFDDRARHDCKIVDNVSYLWYNETQ